MARKLQTVSQFATERGVTEPTCRWWISQAAVNGMQAAGVVVRIGRRVYIDPERFDTWLDQQQPQVAA